MLAALNVELILFEIMLRFILHPNLPRCLLAQSKKHFALTYPNSNAIARLFFFTVE